MINRIITLSGKGSFKAGHYQGISQFYFVGEGSEHRFGTYSANHFIKKFVKRFERDNGKGKSAKQQVTDIYLIDTVKVLPPNLKPVSFAQHLANKLDHHGFSQVRVHSIEKPDYAHLDTLTVKTNLQHYHTSVVMQHQIKQRNIALFNLVEHQDCISELNRPQHTFLSHESLAKRHKRIKHGLTKMQCAHQLEAVSELEKILRDVHDSQSAYQLKQIIARLKLASKEEWLSILEQGKHYIHDTVLGEKLGEMAQSYLPKVEPVTLNNDNNIPAPPPVDELLLAYKQRINVLLETLRAESARLISKRYNLFARYELETKTRKIAALSDLNNANSFLDLYARAFNYINDKRVMRKVKRSFTFDLLTDIINHPPTSVIKAIL